MSGCLLFVTSILLLVASFTLHADSEQKQQTLKKLEQVQQAILDKQSQLEKKQSEQNKIEQSIRQTDKKIGDVSKTLRQIENKLQQVTQQIKRLEKQQETLEQDRQAQVKILAEQVKSIYQVGQHDFMKMMLNQDSPAKLERVLSYYQFLNKARTEAIEKLKQTLAKLEETVTQLNQQRLALAELQQEEKTKQAELVSLKTKQKANLASIEKFIKTESQRIETLKQDETALTQALEALAEAIEELPNQLDFNGLGDIKGKILWPTQGSIKKNFGRRKSGQLRWKGVVIQANSGEVVHNIHAGQVIFSDWLKGYGLVLVVEHGNGYMSLYGHNQALLKDVGDVVQSGEPIALVGQSGGQAKPGLYFEIRHQGQPVNPVDWCR
ncbi:hypothetical protein XM47_13825 [Catenovulum maritimum]|uniref:M23ase beta-sheet core domain-containing protein n=2 Tax=Catenovulum maritimum TaxID=1513271 RepID=A0A0J8GP79_9ALTE|nr:hypothetical protein XM47_13825 [Catenovulum maritimum]